jgi:transposase
MVDTITHSITQAGQSDRTDTISKDTLDVYWLSKCKHKQFSNTKLGLSALIRWIRQTKALLIVFEATGVYHRLLETCLAKHNIPFVRVNPRQARRFCEGTGQLAKTDRVDAKMLAKMGALLELEATQPKSKTLHDLKQLATARLALIKDRTAAKARLATSTHSLLSQQIKRRLRQIERDLTQVTEAIDDIVVADKNLVARAEILMSIPPLAHASMCCRAAGHRQGNSLCDPDGDARARSSER